MRCRLLALAGVVALCIAGTLGADSVQQHGQILIVPTGSAMILQIEPGFRPLPALRIPIGNLTVADRRIFVDADAFGNVYRLAIVQFESVNPDARFKFVYPSKPPEVFGEQVYRFGAYVYDDERAAAKFPDKEAGLTRAFLETHRLTLPRLLRAARLARVGDPDGTSEIIIFYLENADADYPAGPLPDADDDGDLGLDAAGKQQMLERLKAVVHPVIG